MQIGLSTCKVLGNRSWIGRTPDVVFHFGNPVEVVAGLDGQASVTLLVGLPAVGSGLLPLFLDVARYLDTTC